MRVLLLGGTHHLMGVIRLFLALPRFWGTLPIAPSTLAITVTIAAAPASISVPATATAALAAVIVRRRARLAPLRKCHNGHAATETVDLPRLGLTDRDLIDLYTVVARRIRLRVIERVSHEFIRLTFAIVHS